MTDRAERLRPEDIVNAYRLFLGRAPSAAEVSRMANNIADKEALRRVFLGSPEFEKKFVRLKEDIRAKQPVTVIHLHVPKTAGTSLTALLAQTVKPGSSLTMGDHDIQRLVDLPLDERRRLRFIFGHLSHGVAQLLPQRSLYVCTLRHPGERLLSYFHYIRRTKDHPLYARLEKASANFGEFLEIMEQTAGARREVDNGQVRRLAGRAAGGPEEGNPDLLRRALGNLFAPDMVYGLTEDFDGFQRRLLRLGLIRQPRGERRNAAPERLDLAAELGKLSPAQRDLFEDFTALDNRFYDIARIANDSERQAAHMPAVSDMPTSESAS